MLSAPVAMGLDDCLEYIAADELVEVRTPPSSKAQGFRVCTCTLVGPRSFHVLPAVRVICGACSSIGSCV